jgi:hypothetical protein
MYCYHCGEKIDEHKIEAKVSSLEQNKDVIDEKTTVSYVCPRCGYLIHEGATEQDIKSLSAASHAEIQRGRNLFARGMGATSIGAICLILAVVFFRLSFKPAQQNKLITTCPEFYVFIVLLVVAILLLIYGITFVVLGHNKKAQYEKLLGDIQDKTFFQ